MFIIIVAGLAIAGTGHTFPMTTYLPTTSSNGSGNGNGNSSNGNKASSAAAAPPSSLTMAALPQGGFTTIIPPGKLVL